MDASNATASALRGRWAVGAMFLMNGFITGSWAPQIPVFLTRLDISKSTLGLLILLFGVGAVVAMPWSGYLMSRHGSRKVLRGFAVVVSFALLLVALAPNVPVAAVAMLVFGGVVGAMDVAMNANAVVVEKRLGRAIMSSSHAFWSVGGFIGGAGGGLVIQHFGHLVHASLVTAAAIALLAAFGSKLAVDAASVAQAEKHHGFSLPRSPTVYLVGLIALMSMIPEGAVLDWAALYLQQDLGTNLATAGLAFGLFSGAMSIMRFLGDSVRNRFGAVLTMRVSSLIAASGMLVAGLSPYPALTIAAFAFSGIGIANMVPIAFSAGGNQPGIASGVGMSVVTTMGYSGILMAPSIIGFTAEYTGFSIIFIVLSAFLVVVCMMADLVASADFKPQQPAE